jgi:O-succinylbenzoic acid--CoA ligase
VTTLSIFDAAREAPHGIALRDGSTELSFAEVAERCRPFAQALLAARPPVLALTPRADTESLLWLYAALATGTPVLTLHQRATAPERQAAIALAGARELPSPEPTGAAAFSAERLPPVSPATALAYIPTSGSTGTPRLVELSRQAMQASALASAENLGWAEDDTWLLCLPLAHTGGLSIVIRCLLARRSLLLFEPGPSGLAVQSQAFVRVAEQATLMSLVPSMLTLLLDSGFQPSARLRAVLLGGAGCSPALAARAHAARLPLLTSYGLTETASQVVTRRYAERFQPLAERNGAVSSGHPLPGVELRVTDGAIALRTPSLFTRYVGQSARALDQDGWLITTDRGELGPDGALYVRGRSDDVIVTGGENVDPLEVEAALTALPGVKAACVFGTNSERFGQVVTALLVTAERALGEPRHLAGLLQDRLAAHKLPRRLLIADSLPLTSSGKVDRRACSELYRASVDPKRPA